MFNESSMGKAVRGWGFEAIIVDQVDRTRLGHIIDGGNEDDHHEGAENLKEIKLERAPYCTDLIRTKTQDLNKKTHENLDEDEGENMVDEELVAKFNILEFHRIGESRHF